MADPTNITKPTCAIEGCLKPQLARGWCGMHWQRWYTKGDPLALKRRPLPGTCSVEGCDSPPHSRYIGQVMCSLHGQRFSAHRSTERSARQTAEWRVCGVSGCECMARTRTGFLCEKHYMRRHRRGTLTDPIVGRIYVAGHGYVVGHDRDHPLSGKTGTLYEHRRVLFEKVGPEPQSCYWCKRTVIWKAKGKDKLVVDHLDGVKANNDPTNLVASCNRCNGARGLFQHWVMDHKDDPFLHALFNVALKAA
jgi:hypothetical protein